MRTVWVARRRARWRHWPALLILAAALFFCAEAAANDAAFSMRAGTPRIEPVQNVRLESEHLVFRYVPPTQAPPPTGGRCDAGGDDDERGTCPHGWWCGRNGLCSVSSRWQADLTYVLRNTSEEPAQLQIGMPFYLASPEWGGTAFGPTTAGEIEGFETWVDGDQVPVQRVDQAVVDGGVSYNRLYLSEVTFEPGATRTLSHRYLSHPTTYFSTPPMTAYRFLLRTARSWSGPIGEVRIDFQLPPQVLPCIVASLPFERRDDWLSVRLTDWDPVVDFDLMWVPGDVFLPGRGRVSTERVFRGLRTYFHDRDEWPLVADLVGAMFGRPIDPERWPATLETSYCSEVESAFAYYVYDDDPDLTRTHLHYLPPPDAGSGGDRPDVPLEVRQSLAILRGEAETPPLHLAVVPTDQGARMAVRDALEGIADSEPFTCVYHVSAGGVAHEFQLEAADAGSASSPPFCSATFSGTDEMPWPASGELEVALTVESGQKRWLGSVRTDVPDHFSSIDGVARALREAGWIVEDSGESELQSSYFSRRWRLSGPAGTAELTVKEAPGWTSPRCGCEAGARACEACGETVGIAIEADPHDARRGIFEVIAASLGAAEGR